MCIRDRYYSYNDLYGGVERAMESRFSTVVGRLQATGTAGNTATTAESRGQALRRVVEQFDEKDKFEFMLLDGQGVILATSSGTMSRDLTDGTDYGRALTSANGLGSAIFTTPNGERVDVYKRQVHISEISNERVNKVSDVLKVGDEVRVKLTAVDFDRKRISLSMKACLDENGEDAE